MRYLLDSIERSMKELMPGMLHMYEFKSFLLPHSRRVPHRLHALTLVD